MRVTEYFLDSRHRVDRHDIKMEWIEYAVRHPVKKVRQPDNRIRLWAKIEASEGRYLRVILLEDGETVHNAFFDRRFKENV